MRKTISALALVLVICAGIGAYLFSTRVSDNVPVGTIKLFLADPSVGQSSSPSYDPSIQDVVLTFTKIDIHAADSGSDSGWHPLTVGSKTIHLIQPLNLSDLLGSASLPTGKYDLIRLFANTARVVIDGSNVVYSIPSGDHAGLKVPILSGGFMLTMGVTVNVMLSLSFNSQEILAQLHDPNVHHLVPVVTARVQ